MVKKILLAATVDSHILAFHLPYLRYASLNGYEVHVATNGINRIPFCNVKHTVSFGRSPLRLTNVRAFHVLKEIVERERFDIVHAHTPVGGVITRLATRKARKKFGTKVIYTAHGFHFFRGAPWRYWLMFYPIERCLAKFTDTLITINMEDYELARKKFKTDVAFIPGVGIDESKFDTIITEDDKADLRSWLGISEADFVLIYAAELSERKRQIWLIETLSGLMTREPGIHLLLPGRDRLNGRCQALVRAAGLEQRIHFLGFRRDIPRLLSISNIAVSSARQEGLPVNIMEAMYMGLPIVASDCRGNRDLVVNDVNGFLVDIEDRCGYRAKVEEMYSDCGLKERFAKKNSEDMKNYTIKSVIEKYVSVCIES